MYTQSPPPTEHSSEYLEHYGVLGMKWGIRKDRVTTSRKKSLTGLRTPELRGEVDKTPSPSSRHKEQTKSKVTRQRVSKGFKELISSKFNKKMAKVGHAFVDILVSAGSVRNFVPADKRSLPKGTLDGDGVYNRYRPPKNSTVLIPEKKENKKVIH